MVDPVRTTTLEQQDTTVSAPVPEAPKGPVTRFRTVDNQVHSITYQHSRSTEQSVFAVALVKGGSTLLHSILIDLNRFSSRKVLPIARKLFHNGISLDDVVEDVDSLFSKRGYIFGTFRWLPRRLFIPEMESSKKVLLVRDPRDMLVSRYYSFKQSHQIPVGDLGKRFNRARARLQRITLDEYARNAAGLTKSRYLETMSLLGTGSVLLRRYEDIIFDKKSFVADIAEHFDIDLSKDDIESIANKHDVFPETEDPSKHVRQVKPRNFETKLAPDTIEEISHKFRAILSEFGYK